MDNFTKGNSAGGGRLRERQRQIVVEFMGLASWEERYKKIIEMGKALPSMPEELKTEEAKVKGCQSQVWLHAKLSVNGDMEIFGDSDALIVKGLVALLLRIYNHARPEEILGTPPDSLQEIGFAGNLSPS